MTDNDNLYQFTEHARRRSQQRAITTRMVDIVLDYGEWFHDRNGSMTAWMTRKALASVAPALLLLAMHCMGVAVTISAEGAIVTVQRAPHMKREWRGGR
ncbi:MAG: DUF4258 domain-containing protein [Phycisphaerales bacterium]|nr:DUF4258 domain-containing protein [Phycisphaerales bacterium]